MKKKENKYHQLCMWPSTICDRDDINEFKQFFKKEFGVRVKYETQVLTLADVDNGRAVPDTGGRNDLFFYIHNDDISKFAVPRLQVGIRWWEDVIKYNDNSHLYTEDFLNRYPAKW